MVFSIPTCKFSEACLGIREYAIYVGRRRVAELPEQRIMPTRRELPEYHKIKSSPQSSNDPGQDFPMAEIRVWVRDIFFAAVTSILIVVFVIQPVKVEGTSMEPKLEPQDRIFVNRMVYRFTQIERGDIIVFWYPREPSKSFIKRVVGLPGERVEIRSGIVLINNQPLNELYVLPGHFDRGSHAPEIVQSEHYFVLGDHRSLSNDSRDWGLVPGQNVLGKAIFRYWPLSRFGVIY